MAILVTEHSFQKKRIGVQKVYRYTYIDWKNILDGSGPVRNGEVCISDEIPAPFSNRGVCISRNRGPKGGCIIILFILKSAAWSP